MSYTTKLNSIICELATSEHNPPHTGTHKCHFRPQFIVNSQSGDISYTLRSIQRRIYAFRSIYLGSSIFLLLFFIWTFQHGELRMRCKIFVSQLSVKWIEFVVSTSWMLVTSIFFTRSPPKLLAKSKGSSNLLFTHICYDMRWPFRLKRSRNIYCQWKSVQVRAICSLFHRQTKFKFQFIGSIVALTVIVIQPPQCLQAK